MDRKNTKEWVFDGGQANIMKQKHKANNDEGPVSLANPVTLFHFILIGTANHKPKPFYVKSAWCLFKKKF